MALQLPLDIQTPRGPGLGLAGRAHQIAVALSVAVCGMTRLARAQMATKSLFKERRSLSQVITADLCMDRHGQSDSKNMLRAAPGRRVLLHPSRCCRRSISTLLPSVDVGGERSEVRNVWCIGRNYAAHARELGNAVPTEEPVIFLKASSACRPLSAGPIAFESETFHHEIEMVLLVGEHVPLGGLTDCDPTACVRAVGLGLDLTRRGKQTELKKAGLPWTLAKSFAGQG